MKYTSSDNTNASNVSSNVSGNATGTNEGGGFRLAFRYRFEAAHRFTQSCADSCATPHGHTWYAKAVFSSASASLGDDVMVMEFSVLKRAWKTFITETVDHSFLHHFEDPILPALRDHVPKFRGLPFPGGPTTELISALFFAKLSTMHESLRASQSKEGSGVDGGAASEPTSGVANASAPWPKPISVVIRETPTNQLTFRAGPAGESLLARLNEKYEGWWQVADPAARHLRKRD